MSGSVNRRRRRKTETGNGLRQDVREELGEGPSQELGNDAERPVGRECRKRIHLEEVRLTCPVETEVRATEIPALEGLERALTECDERRFERRVERARRDVTPPLRWWRVT